MTQLKHIHFTGIKGVGMTSLALIARDLGIKVTGSDIEEVFVTDETLKKNNLKWSVGFSGKNLKPKPDLVITTGAHGGLKNPEVLEAKRLGIPIMTHAQALAEFSKGKNLIAVAGVGGKTTTSAMIATILEKAGKHPSFAIGVGNIPSLGTPGRFDEKGEEFVTEADEYAVSPGTDNRPRFSLLNPKIIVSTNIEHDHPDIYPTIKETKRAFRAFFEKLPGDGLLVANLDNKNTKKVLKGLEVPIVTYGKSPKADWRINKVCSIGISNVAFPNQKTTFFLNKKIKISLNLPGVFNALNATAAFIVAKKLKLPVKTIVEGLASYKGSSRRAEKIGEKRGILVYDDYAHHPKQISSTLRAFRLWFPKKRIIAVFQPHTYSRTKALFASFAQSFRHADLVVLMDIYSSARESESLAATSESLALEIDKYDKEVFYTGGEKETVDFLVKKAKKGDLILTMGAGSIFHTHKDLLSRL